MNKGTRKGHFTDPKPHLIERDKVFEEAEKKREFLDAKRKASHLGRKDRRS